MSETMKAWSEQAELRLREWLAERVEQEELHGVEADEIGFAQELIEGIGPAAVHR